MIIGISGKKQHGKDTTAKVLDWIFSNVDPAMPALYEFVEDGALMESNWQYVKFADKLKDIICMLTGCTRIQLEDDTFKNSFMPIEWNRKVYGSYASNFGKIIQTEETYKWNPKFYCIDYDTEDEKEVDHRRRDSMAFFTDRINVFDPSNYRDRKYCIQERRTYRDALQTVGTELFRVGFCDNTWVNATMADYKPTHRIGLENHTWDPDPLPNWFITDVRFPNEADIIKKNGGIMIRVNRIGMDCSDMHPSETALDNYQGFDFVIENDGDLLNLYKSLSEIVLKLYKWQTKIK